MISEEELEKVALLARLTLSKEEKSLYAQQFQGILRHFEEISKVPTQGVAPLVTPTDMEQFLRPDEMKTWPPGVDGALSNAPERSGNLFKVPPVV